MIAAAFFTLAALNMASLAYWLKQGSGRARLYGAGLAWVGLVVCTAVAVDSLRRGE